tara:strand:+ start:166 stop:960 length:795 start_codon:yes stop_codon:yes gene_type:complete
MARKHRRRTRKRGGSVKAKLLDGFKGLQNVGENTLRKGKELGYEINDGLDHFSSGYRSAAAGGPLYNNPSLQSTQPVTAPRTEQDKLGNVTEVAPDQTDLFKENPLPPMETTNQSTNQPTKEKQGGLLGLGTWFGLGGRRLSHSSFINKMLRVRNKTKRNKAIRKYLKGGKKKSRKRKTKRRGGMNPQGGDNNLPRRQPQQRQRTEEERLAEVRRQVHAMQSRRMEEARRRERAALLAEANKPDHLFGGKRKRKNKTKKRRRRR